MESIKTVPVFTAEGFKDPEQAREWLRSVKIYLDKHPQVDYHLAVAKRIIVTEVLAALRISKIVPAIPRHGHGDGKNTRRRRISER